MRIAVFGAGGVGGHFGAQLAKAGHDVSFIARGKHLAALRTHGLTVESAAAPVQLASVVATDDPGSLGAVDVVMFCPKLWDVEAAAQQAAPLVAQGTVIPFQNGVESHEILRRTLGAERVAGGVAHIAATIKAPGVIAHTGTLARLRVGAFPDAGAETKARVQAFVDAGRAAGIDIDTVPDITRALWEKFVFLVAFSGVTCLARQPAGVIRSEADLRATLLASMEETVAVALARGVSIERDLAAKQLTFVDNLPAEMRSSMLNDLTQGSRLEAPWLAGAVVRFAQALDLPAPVNRTLYAAMKPYLNGAS
ncbi:MAG TPA: 2-dehydropantoate 2-reductase [Burkholderiaceae bacterium]|nr:2-dehydropantoate 2-reductase [Burkholderiaceae bacterium]